MSRRYRDDEEKFEWTTKRILAVCLLITLILTGGVVIFFSFKSVGATSYGLKINWINKRISEDAYGPGFHFIGIEHEFIRFPSTTIEVQFFESADDDATSPLDSRSSDGLLIEIQLSFHYRLVKEDLYDLYKTFAKRYNDAISGQARSTLRDVAANYKAIEFFFNRTQIANDMELALSEELGDMFSYVVFFQLREFDLPDDFEESIRKVQIAQQDIEAAKYEQQAAIIRAETAIFEAVAFKNATIVNAEATAEAFLINIDAQAQALNITLTAERLAYYAFAETLNMSSSELLAYLWIKAIMEHDESMLIIGTNTPAIVVDYLNTTESTP
jgi:regulator of protease activity HflC (stomatin/prohibitin superfamily)